MDPRVGYDPRNVGLATSQAGSKTRATIVDSKTFPPEVINAPVNGRVFTPEIRDLLESRELLKHTENWGGARWARQGSVLLVSAQIIVRLGGLKYGFHYVNQAFKGQCSLYLLSNLFPVR